MQRLYEILLPINVGRIHEVTLYEVLYGLSELDKHFEESARQYGIAMMRSIDEQIMGTLE